MPFEAKEKHMPKIDIGVGQEFPLEEKRRDDDCAGRADNHHFGHWFSRGRCSSSREDARETRPDSDKTDKE